MIDCSSTIGELKQRLEELEYRIGWLNGLLQETQLKLQELQTCCLESEAITIDVEDYPLAGNVLDFIDDARNMYQLSQDFDPLTASNQEIQEMQSKLWHNIVWFQKILTGSQAERKQVVEVIECKMQVLRL
jgi:chaperonin cofactor prefoldin